MNSPAIEKTLHTDTNGVYATLTPCAGETTDTHFVFHFSVPAIAGGSVTYDSVTHTTTVAYTSGAQSTASDIAVGDALIATLANMGVL